MGEASAASAQGYREHMRDKAARLGGGEDAVSVDASSFTPGEPLDADVKTGMRPVSRQARKRGGVVHGEASPLGEHALKRPGRRARASGGQVGIDYVNRNAKAANEERAGKKHDLGLKAGGRAHKAGGGPLGALGGLLPLAIGEIGGSAPDEGNKAPPYSPGTGRAMGGRAGSNDESVYHPRKERAGAAFQRDLTKSSASAAEVDVPKRIVRASGGRVGRAVGGPLAPPISNQGLLGSFNYRPGGAGVPGASLGFRDGGRTKAHERYGAGPGPAEHHPGLEGRKAYQDGGAVPGPDENEGTSGAGPLGVPGPAEGPIPVGVPAMRKRSPRGENNPRNRSLHAKGGVAEGALKQHRAEHKAMGAEAHPKGCTCKACGGKAERAAGGRVARARGGKGKMNVNIVIGTPGGQSGGLPPVGANPQLGIRPPTPPPAPMPMPGAAPGAMPMPMPIPMPGAAGPAGPPGPPGMPPRARGGRAPRIKGEPEAGSGSGIGRLQKIEAYGHRSREGSGLRR